MKKGAAGQLVFVPAPAIGHLVSTVEFAKRLLDHDPRLSITFLLIENPSPSSSFKSFTQFLAASDTRIRYVNLPQLPSPSPDLLLKSYEKCISDYIKSHKPHVKHWIAKAAEEEGEHSSSSSGSAPVSGFFVDLFCSSMIDVADELGIPSYVFFTSGAALLGYMLHLPVHHREFGRAFELSDADLVIPAYANPVLAKVAPAVSLNKEGGYECFVEAGARFWKAQGIVVNTFAELQPHAMSSLVADDRLPEIYAVGPMLQLAGHKVSRSGYNNIMNWLDSQPPSSVVFLCFGSQGSLEASQLEQIAIALERSGQRFLWSIRKPPQEGRCEPSEYTNYEDVQPEGFLERTENKGLVSGWAPQAAALAHEAIGGFVSHCGWNSILESLWFGVPIATWPLYAEQQINAWEMVRELGLAVELKLDYRLGWGEVVMADEIERAIRDLMAVGDEKTLALRKRVKETSEKSRKALMKDGSSFASLERLITNISQA